MPMKLLRTAAALTVTGLACATLVAGTGVAAAAAGPVLNGPQRGLAAEGSAVTISGTAPVGSTVDIWFHRRNPHLGPQVYVKRRSLPVGADGRFRTTYVAKDDYRYYAQVGSVKSSVHLTRVPVQITMTQVPVWTIMTQVPGRIRRSATATPTGLSGRAIPYTVVKLHLHAKGTAPGVYNIVRTANVLSDGIWGFRMPSDTDYRVFAISGANNTSTRSYFLPKPR
jgi:hypothetical protein